MDNNTPAIVVGVTAILAACGAFIVKVVKAMRPGGQAELLRQMAADIAALRATQEATGPALQSSIEELSHQVERLDDKIDAHGQRLTKVETEIHFLLGGHGPKSGVQ